MKDRAIVAGLVLTLGLAYVVFFNPSLIPWNPDCGALANAETIVG